MGAKFGTLGTAYIFILSLALLTRDDSPIYRNFYDVILNNLELSQNYVAYFDVCQPWATPEK